MTVCRLALLLAVPLLACNQQTPPGDETSDGGMTGTSDPSGELDSYYPLIPGSSYTYRHVDGQGTVTGLEIVNVSATSWNGEAGVLMADEPDASGQSTDSTIVRRGTQALRVHKEVKTNGVVDLVVDYTPGFLRMDDSWTSPQSAGIELSYMRSETDGEGQNQLTEVRSHVWRVVGVDEQVEVNAGVFSCVHVQRQRTSDRSDEGEVVDLWFARGVGKVRERRESETDGISEELLDVVTLGTF